jgi:hypothetical protein
MNFILSKHARERMTQRRVTAAQVKHVMDVPSSATPTPESSIRYEGTFSDGRTLKVWVVAVDNGAGGMVPKHGPGGRVIVKSVAWRGEPDA